MERLDDRTEKDKTGKILTIGIVIGGILLLLGWLTGFPWPS
jgi:hypothetical protein